MEAKSKRKISTGNMGKVCFEKNIWRKGTRKAVEEKDKRRVGRIV